MSVISKIDVGGTEYDIGIKADLASISVTGSTNTTGSTITNGTYFYLNGILVLALSDIANEASFTENTNYMVVTAGALNELQDWKTMTGITAGTNVSSVAVFYKRFGSRTFLRGGFKVGAGGISASDVIFSGSSLSGQGAMAYSVPYGNSGVATYLNGTLRANSAIGTSSGNSYTFCGIV